MWTTKTQISLRIHAVWSAPLLLCCLHSVILIPAIFKISNLYLASVAVQAGLSTLVTNPEDRFSCDLAHFNSLYFSWHFTVIYFCILFYPTFHSDLFLHIVLPNISQWFIFAYYSTQHFTVIYFPILFYSTFHSDLFSHIILPLETYEINHIYELSVFLQSSACDLLATSSVNWACKLDTADHVLMTVNKTWCIPIKK